MGQYPYMDEAVTSLAPRAPLPALIGLADPTWMVVVVGRNSTAVTYFPLEGVGIFRGSVRQSTEIK